MPSHGSGAYAARVRRRRGGGGAASSAAPAPRVRLAGPDADLDPELVADSEVKAVGEMLLKASMVDNEAERRAAVTEALATAASLPAASRKHALAFRDPDTGQTALHVAILRKQDLNVVKAIVATSPAEASRAVTKSLAQPLHLLLQIPGADPVVVASIAQYLLAAGAPYEGAEACDAKGLTPFDYAQSKSIAAIKEPIENQRREPQRLVAGVSEVDKGGEELLGEVKRHEIDMNKVRKIFGIVRDDDPTRPGAPPPPLRAKIAARATDDNGWTPLHWAAVHGDLGTALFLIALDANVNAVTHDGDTPLHLAAREGHADVARALLEKFAFASLHIKNNGGHDPAALATRHFHQRCLMVLTGMDMEAATAACTAAADAAGAEARDALGGGAGEEKGADAGAGVGADAGPLEECCVCWDDEVPKRLGITCTDAHFTCNLCARDCVEANMNAGKLRTDGFAVKCAKGGCNMDLDPAAVVKGIGSEAAGNLLAFALSTLSRYDQDVTRVNRVVRDATGKTVDEMETELREAEEERRAARSLPVLRRKAHEAVADILTLRCPRCRAPYYDYNGCASLTCANAECATHFCAVCLLDCGADAHAHCKEVHGTWSINAAKAHEMQKPMHLTKIKEYLATKPEEHRAALAAHVEALTKPRIVAAEMLE